MMNRFFAALFALLALVVPASAQKTKATITTEINTNYPDNSTQLITPALVRSTTIDQVNSYQQAPQVRSVTTTSDTLTVADFGNVVTYSNAAAIAVTIAQATGSFASFNVYVKNTGVGLVTITPTTSTINGAATLSLATGQSAFIVSDGTNYQLGTSGITNSQLFTANGTWTKPAGVTSVYVYECGGGGGGGGGAQQASGSAASGGAGGGGGACYGTTLRASDIGATAAITVGAAGTAGAGATTTTTAGGNGGDGGFSQFQDNSSSFRLKVPGGTHGSGGQLATLASGGTGGSVSSIGGVSGQTGTNGINGAAGTNTALTGGAFGGAAGGGISTTPAAFAGGGFGGTPGNIVTGDSCAGSVGGAAGANGTTDTVTYPTQPGCGGSGGGSQLGNTGAPGAGSAGVAGSGGGGGGSVCSSGGSCTAQNGGAGGAGGLGFVWVVAW